MTDGRWKSYFDRKTELAAHQGCLFYGMHAVVPQRQQALLFEDLHEGNPGILRSKELARGYVWWPTINADLEKLVKSCQACQKQCSAPSAAPLHPWLWPTSPWRRLHLDFAGPICNTMFLVAVDAHSKWPEVFAMNETLAEKTIQCLNLRQS